LESIVGSHRRGTRRNAEFLATIYELARMLGYNAAKTRMLAGRVVTVIDDHPATASQLER
jgi:hypothetical protein